MLSLHPVVQVGDAALTGKDTRALQLHLLGGKVVEQSPPLAQKHRDNVQLQFVQYPRGQGQLRDRRTVDKNVLVAGCLLRAADRNPDIVDVCDKRPGLYVQDSMSSAGACRLRMKIGTPSW
jgi:hypothetical protein